MMESLFKIGLCGSLAAAMPTGGTPDLWAQWGLAGMVVAYTLWRDHTREKRMSETLAQHHAEAARREQWMQTTLLSALERNTIAMERMTDHFREVPDVDSD